MLAGVAALYLAWVKIMQRIS